MRDDFDSGWRTGSRSRRGARPGHMVAYSETEAAMTMLDLETAARRLDRSGLGDRDPGHRHNRPRTATRSGPRRRSRRVTHVVRAIAVAAAVVTTRL